MRSRSGEIRIPLDALLVDGIGPIQWAKPGFVKVLEKSISNEQNMVVLARRNHAVHTVIMALAAEGYLHYWAEDGEARFMHRTCIESHWGAVRTRGLSVSSAGVVYAVSAPRGTANANRMVVVFSGISHRYNDPSLWRYFTKNYQHLEGLIPGDTLVLRIADIGGVCGSFYGDTLDAPQNSASVQSLIAEIASEHGISPASVCLLGSSKGASGAVRHAVEGEYSFVAADPILNDSYYERHHNDDHFTTGPVFIKTKEEVFSEMIAGLSSGDLSRSDRRAILLTSPASPQCRTVLGFAEDIAPFGETSVYVSNDERITGHPSVASAVLGSTIALVNAVLLEWSVPCGRLTIEAT